MHRVSLGCLWQKEWSTLRSWVCTRSAYTPARSGSDAVGSSSFGTSGPDGEAVVAACRHGRWVGVGGRLDG